MGVRKKNRAEALKDARKNVAFAKLNNCPTSPRKMRLVADIIRGEDVDKALHIFEIQSKEASMRLEKLLLSALAIGSEKRRCSNGGQSTFCKASYRR